MAESSPRRRRKGPTVSAEADLFAQVVRAANVAWYEWHAETGAITTSPALTELFGFAPDSWSVAEHARLTHPDDLAAYRDAVKAAFKSGAARVETLYRVRRPDGAWRWAHEQAVIQRTGDGRVMRMIGAVADVTEARDRETALREALEQQTATSEILGVINSSFGNLAPVFDAMLENAMRLCDATCGGLFAYDGTGFQTLATRGVPAPFAEYRHQNPPTTLEARPTPLLETRAPVHVLDIAETDGYKQGSTSDRAIVDLGGARTLLNVPLLKHGEVVGYISVYRSVVRAFSDKQIALLENFAAQAVIAMENARLITEQREALEQQTATAEMLEVINKSPGNLAPVFDAILEKGLRLIDAAFGTLLINEGETLRVAATRGMTPALARFRAENPVIGHSPTSRHAYETRRSAQQLDNRESEGYRAGLPGPRAVVDLGGARTMLVVPLLTENAAIGCIQVYRQEVRAFTGQQIALMENFAAQAVIAMENARLITEQREALEQQTATAEVLGVINAHPGDLDPVFDSILENAHDICGATIGALTLYENGMVRIAASRGFVQAHKEIVARGFLPTPGHQALIDGEKLYHVPDLIAVTDSDIKTHPVTDSLITNMGIRTVLHVPLRRDNATLGAITAYRLTVSPFSEKEISLLENFAAQAVIAMENARLITEQREALERQTATAEVLSVINANPGNLGPVFDTLLEKACHLCDADSGGLWSVKDGMVHCPVTRGFHPAVREFLSTPRQVDPETGIGRLMHGAQMAHIADLADGPAYHAGDPLHRLAVDVGGIHSLIAVPLKKDGVLFGAFGLTRREAQAFSDKHIALVQNFAAQAVIAMENARLLEELRERTAALAQRNSEFGERIEQQSATIDVLKVMSSSPGDPQPVFELIATRAREFCQADVSAIGQLDGGQLLLRSHTGRTGQEAKEYEATFPRPVDTSSMFGRAILGREPVILPDLRADPMHYRFGATRMRGIAAVPMMRSQTPIGAIAIGRFLAGEFSPAQVELLHTFAEQAVIAITSAETYNELQDRTAALAQRNNEFGERIEQQSATIDVLKVMSGSPGDPTPVFDMIARRAQELCSGAGVRLVEFDGQLVHLRAIYGADPAAKATYEAAFPITPTRGSVLCRAILDRQITYIRNMDTESGLFAIGKNLGMKAVLAVPLLRDGNAIGAISIGSTEYDGFTESQIALLRTFAEQAVIAITSAENHRALQERTDELTRSVNELQALEETIRAVNSSLDLDTVLATIIDRAAQLSEADEGTIYEFDEAGQVFVPKAAFGMSAARIEALRQRRVRLGETHLGRAALQRAPVHVSDVQQDPDLARELTGVLAGIHAVLAVPLLREDKVVGGLVIRRRAAGDFAPGVPTLLQTFAGQCVLAIENARLFHQLGERGEEARRAREAAETALENLRRAQDRLVQSEKLASLGQLTAGVAHEIKNPLNFVNNFSELSIDLLDELNEAVGAEKLHAPDDLRAEIDELTEMLKGNLAKIAEHGRRADSIVKNMLLHARAGGGEQRPVDVNALADEALNLAYHGARAETPGFNITMEKDFDPAVGTVELLPQEFTRVLVNLINNGFYAARKRAEAASNGFEPTLRVSTQDRGEQVDIRVRDNGTGIPAAVRDKIFEPFFTTKPAGEGTGLGLSLSYDIIVKQHGGQLTVDSEPGSFTEFRIVLPRHPSAAARGDGGKT